MTVAVALMSAENGHPVAASVAAASVASSAPGTSALARSRSDDPVTLIDLVHRDRAANVHALGWRVQPRELAAQGGHEAGRVRGGEELLGLVFPWTMSTREAIVEDSSNDPVLSPSMPDPRAVVPSQSISASRTMRGTTP